MYLFQRQQDLRPGPWCARDCNSCKSPLYAALQTGRSPFLEFRSTDARAGARVLDSLVWVDACNARQDSMAPHNSAYRENLCTGPCTCRRLSYTPSTGPVYAHHTTCGLTRMHARPPAASSQWRRDYIQHLRNECTAVRKPSRESDSHGNYTEREHTAARKCMSPHAY